MGSPRMSVNAHSGTLPPIVGSTTARCPPWARSTVSTTRREMGRSEAVFAGS